MSHENTASAGTLVETKNECSPNTNCCNESAVQAKQVDFARTKPAVDILESEESVTLIADVPGASEATVDLAFEKGVLSLNARTDFNDPEGPFARVRKAREYVRSFRIADELDVSTAEAIVSHGVLTVQIPKKPAAVPAKIKVRGAS